MREFKNLQYLYIIVFNSYTGCFTKKYSRISPFRLPSISNISLSRTRSSVPWRFVSALGKIPLSISNISLSRTKYLVPRMRFQANFLSLSRTFKMMSIMNFLSSKLLFLNVTKWKNIQRKPQHCVILSNNGYLSRLFALI